MRGNKKGMTLPGKTSYKKWGRSDEKDPNLPPSQGALTSPVHSGRRVMSPRHAHRDRRALADSRPVTAPSRSSEFQRHTPTLSRITIIYIPAEHKEVSCGGWGVGFQGKPAAGDKTGRQEDEEGTKKGKKKFWETLKRKLLIKKKEVMLFCGSLEKSSYLKTHLLGFIRSLVTETWCNVKG